MISGGKFFNMVRSTVFKNLYFGNALSFIYMLFFFTVFYRLLLRQFVFSSLNSLCVLYIQVLFIIII